MPASSAMANPAVPTLPAVVAPVLATSACRLARPVTTLGTVSAVTAAVEVSAPIQRPTPRTAAAVASPVTRRVRSVRVGSARARRATSPAREAAFPPPHAAPISIARPSPSASKERVNARLTRMTAAGEDVSHSVVPAHPTFKGDSSTATATLTFGASIPRQTSVATARAGWAVTGPSTPRPTAAWWRPAAPEH
jgi:hypothetical protein